MKAKNRYYEERSLKYYSEEAPFEIKEGEDMSDEWVEIEIDELVRESDEAILIRIEDEETWVPQSQCDQWPEEGESGTVIMKEWIAIEKDLI